MKRQNSSTSDNDDHTRNTADSNRRIYPLEMSPTIMTTPPYNNRNSSALSSHGRRRAAKKKRHDNNNVVGTRSQPSLIVSHHGGRSALPTVATTSGINSPTSNHHDATNNNNNSNNNATIQNKMTMPNSSQEYDKDTSKKLNAPPTVAVRTTRNNNPLISSFSMYYHMLTNKLQYYRKKLSNLTPRQKLVVCTLVIVWKFIQAWLIVRGVVWLSGGGGAADDHHGGGGSGREGVSVVQVGKSLDQRMKLDEELQFEIELSRVEENRLEEQLLWMDKDGHQYVRLDKVEEEVERKEDGSDEEEWIEESGMDTVSMRILYMLTVTCDDTQQPQFLQHTTKESTAQHQQQQQQQRRDGRTNTNDSSSNLNSSTTATNIDSILSTLSTNIQTMISHPEGYAVDVYWILGCTWSDYQDLLHDNQLNRI